MSRKRESKKQTTASPKVLRYVVLCVAILVFAVSSLVTIVNLYSKIDEKEDDLKAINNKIAVQEIENNNMKEMINPSDKKQSEYMEQIARDDLDYIYQGERVFVNVSGD